jgi:hypothetical protein
MKIIELKGDIYDVLSDGVAGENCIVYHNGTANVFSNMERIYHSPNFTNSSVRRNPHTRSCIYRELLSIWRTKLFSIFGYEEGAGLLKNQGFR